jgi:hypothetical protein
MPRSNASSGIVSSSTNFHNISFVIVRTKRILCSWSFDLLLRPCQCNVALLWWPMCYSMWNSMHEHSPLFVSNGVADSTVCCSHHSRWSLILFLLILKMSPLQRK